MGLNKFMGIGRLGQDPEVKDLEHGKLVRFSIAINETWTDRDGNKKEKTEWVSCSAFGKLADLCAMYLVKGKMVFVEGKLETRSWDKDGVRMSATNVKVENVQFLGDRFSEKVQDGMVVQKKQLPNYATNEGF